MNAAPVNDVDHSEHFTAYVIESLREDYRLRADEAERAVGLFLQRKTAWSTPTRPRSRPTAGGPRPSNRPSSWPAKPNNARTPSDLATPPGRGRWTGR